MRRPALGKQIVHPAACKSWQGRAGTNEDDLQVKNNPLSLIVRREEGDLSS